MINEVNEINQKLFNHFFNKFSKKKKLILAFPSLLSKSILSKDLNYWNKRYSFKIKLILKIIKFPLFRFLLNFIKINNYCENQKKIGRKVVCLLTRKTGIRNNDSYEDYRFKNLEKKLVNNNLSVIYYCKGKRFKSNAKNLILFSKDIDILVDFILNLNFLFNSFKCNRNYLFKWEYDLRSVYLSSKILSFFIKKIDSVFFLDFNYQHYPLFLAGHFNEIPLVGSMHAFHPYRIIPWISSKCLKQLKIKYLFNDYYSCLQFSNFKFNENTFKKINWNSNLKKVSIVIIQENQNHQYPLLKYIKKNKRYIDDIYVKFRLDNCGVDTLKIYLDELNLEFKEIKNLYSSKTKDYLFFGNSSTLLLDLALEGRRVYSFSNDGENDIEKPVRNFVNLLKKSEISNLKYSQNPKIISKKCEFKSLFKNISLFPSNSAINHKMFNKYKIDNLISLIMNSIK
tara:strand:+ start:963 stop:2324 length:1362 start_codon:yes stop_codon:yes gene_type:complete